MLWGKNAWRIVAIAGVAFAATVPANASAARLAPRVLPPPPPTCAAVTFIGARGSGQPFGPFAGLGPEVDRMAGILAFRLRVHSRRLTLVRAGDPYSADSVNDLKPSAAEIALLLVDPGAGHRRLDARQPRRVRPQHRDRYPGR